MSDQSPPGNPVVTALLVFMITLVIGLIGLPNLSGTAHYMPQSHCLRNQRTFQGFLEMYDAHHSSASSAPHLEITRDTIETAMASLTAARVAMGVAPQTDLPATGRCPVCEIPYLAVRDQVINQTVIFCRLHGNLTYDLDNVTVSVATPPFPQIHEDEFKQKQDAYRGRFIRAKYFMGLDPDQQKFAAFIFALIMGFLAWSLKKES